MRTEEEIYLEIETLKKLYKKVIDKNPRAQKLPELIISKIRTLFWVLGENPVIIIINRELIITK